MAFFICKTLVLNSLNVTTPSIFQFEMLSIELYNISPSSLMSPPNSPVLVASSPDPSSPTVLLAGMNLAESHHRKPSTHLKLVRFVLPSPVECLAGKRRPFDEVDLEEDECVHVDHARFPPFATASFSFKKPRI